MFLMALAVFTLLPTSDSSILKRSVEDMARMVKASTGQSALAFNDYGNYCGLGGRGIPVDGIDRCCSIHDRCYSHINRNGCFPYLIPYRYVIEGRNIYCLGSGNPCGDITCQCDKELAECISHYPYNGQFKHLPDLRPLIENIVRLTFGHNHGMFK